MTNLRCMNPLGSRVTALVAMAVVAISSPADVQAHHLGSSGKPVCDKVFPCADEIKDRVQFWIDVFSKWGTDELVLHDTNHPERVYAVVKSKVSCTEKRGSRVAERHRKKVASDLRALAKRVNAGNTVFSDEEMHYLKLFPSRSASRIKKSASTIRCQQGNRDRFARALASFGQYRPMVERYLSQQGVPDDIKYLPFVESAYNPEAYSRVGAAGLWQIMPRTARTLGLQLNATIDERLDPEAATRAAGLYLHRARQSLEKEARKKGLKITDAKLNPFVITSYNYGVSGMRRAVRSHGLDFVEVLNKYKSRSFRTAVRNFYASFLAARHVATHQIRFFPDIKKLPPYNNKIVELKAATSLARVENVFGVSADELKPLNPALTRFIWHRWRFIPAGYRLRLPAGNDWSQAITELAALAPEEEQSAGTTYRVKRGDTACGVAHAFRVKCRDLVLANELGRRSVIRVGQKLTIPGKAAPRKSQTRTAESRTAEVTSQSNYRVRRGDTACAIAKKLGVSCRALIKDNKLGRRGVIQVGQRLKVPGSGNTKTQAAETTTETVQAAAPMPASVTVKSGDTPCGIARRYKLDCKTLMATNSISRRGLIRVGQKLSLPGGGEGDTEPAVLSDETEIRVVVVKKGDTPCKIARRIGVSCKKLMTKNGIGKRGFIRPGQALSVPGIAVAKAITDSGDTIVTDSGAVISRPMLIKVKSGDTPCGIAKRHSIACSDLMQLNGLSKASIIHIDQTLRLSGDSEVDSDESVQRDKGVVSNAPKAPSLVQDEPVLDDSEPATDVTTTTTDSPLDDIVDLSVRVSDSGKHRYTIKVEPEETIGHYADWLNVGFAGPVRRLNGLSSSAAVLIGQRIRLPVDNQDQLAVFEARRNDYHRMLIEQFKERFTINVVDDYKVSSGDSSWSIAAKNEMPLWLLTRYNPSLRTRAPKLGQILKLPIIVARDSSKEPPTGAATPLPGASG